MMRVCSGQIFLFILACFSVLTVKATETNGTERYYEPLDKLAGNPVLLSRNKEAPAASSADKFSFPSHEYAARMARIQGCTWNAATASHLNKLTGVYAERMYDALGIYAEVHSAIADEFRKRQVPEIYQMLAPMLSGMNIHYVARDGKRGVWQLDIVTATRYGLTVSDVRDDRDDPVLASRAAASYIKDLMSQFRSPEAVIWAYVSSPAEVRRAFSRADSPTPQEAAAFLPEYVKLSVPVFSAWAFIWTYIEKDNLPVFMPAIFLPYENVITSGKTHLGQISEVLEIPLSSLKELNPTLKKQYAEHEETIHLPQGYASRFLAMATAISKHKDSLFFRQENLPRPSVQYASRPGSLNTTVKKYHKVKPGETLSQLAQKYHVSVSSLKKWNNLKSSGIYAGQKIVVQVSVQNRVAEREDLTVRENLQIEGTPANQTATPIHTDSPQTETPEPEEPKTVVSPPKPKTTSAWTYYTVRSGDTLSSIGRKYGVSYTKIKEWNGLRSDKLQIGQKLKIKKR